MKITISPTADVPIYQQIYQQISAQIMQGELQNDFCLPPIRTVAKELRVSVITVKRAWEELERDGFIYTMAGKGCFVAPLSQTALVDKRSELVCEKLEKDMEYFKKLGLSKAELLDFIKKNY
jgi:GntR family transcriptional regulator